MGLAGHDVSDSEALRLPACSCNITMAQQPGGGQNGRSGRNNRTFCAESGLYMLRFREGEAYREFIEVCYRKSHISDRRIA